MTHIAQLTVGFGTNKITFCDERRRVTDRQVDPHAYISVTIDSADRSWGEFMDRRDALALRAWLDLALS